MRLVGFKQTFEFGARITKTNCTNTKVIPGDLRMFHQVHNQLRSAYLGFLRVLNGPKVHKLVQTV